MLFVFFFKCCKRRNGSGESRKQTKWQKLISSENKWTFKFKFLLPFYQTVDGNRTQTDFEKNFRFDFCVHIIRFFSAESMSQRNISDGKSYCVTAPITVPQLLFQQTAILWNHWTSSSKIRRYNFHSYCQRFKWSSANWCVPP